MNKFKKILNSYFYLLVIVGLILIAACAFSIKNWYDTREFNRAAAVQSIEANKAVQEAQNANNQAAVLDLERRTEDVLRDSVIEPKLNRSRRKSANSKIELQRAKQKYSDEKIIHKNISSSVVDNCLRLHRLFPAEKFEYCAGQN